MFGNHFRISNARMVQSVESVWTVLLLGGFTIPAKKSKLGSPNGETMSQ